MSSFYLGWVKPIMLYKEEVSDPHHRQGHFAEGGAEPSGCAWHPLNWALPRQLLDSLAAVLPR